MSCVDSLKISEEKKKYIVDVLNPVLEELVTDLLKKCPEDPLKHLEEYVIRKRGNASGGTSSGQITEQEHAELKQEIKFLKEKMEESTYMVATMAQQVTEKAEVEENSEDEEDEDDDDVDELPESYRMPDKVANKARSSVSAEAYGSWNQKKDFTPPVVPKTDEQKSRLGQVLTKSFMFSSLEEKDLAIIIDAMGEMVCEKDKTVIEQGDDGDFLFVVESGQLDCFKKTSDEPPAKVKTCEAGDCFGELALLYNCPRAATVISTTESVLWKLDRGTFNHIVKDSAAKKREIYQAFLKKTALLRSVDSYQTSQIADALKSQSFKVGDELVKENDPGDRFYLIEGNR